MEGYWGYPQAAGHCSPCDCIYFLIPYIWEVLRMLQVTECGTKDAVWLLEFGHQEHLFSKCSLSNTVITLRSARSLEGPGVCSPKGSCTSSCGHYSPGASMCMKDWPDVCRLQNPQVLRLGFFPLRPWMLRTDTNAHADDLPEFYHIHCEYHKMMVVLCMLIWHGFYAPIYMWTIIS